MDDPARRAGPCRRPSLRLNLRGNSSSQPCTSEPHFDSHSRPRPHRPPPTPAAKRHTDCDITRSLGELLKGELVESDGLVAS